MPKKLLFRKVRPAHRPREEKELRVLVGASVRATTKRKLMGITTGRYHIGRVLDSLVVFAEARGFFRGGS